MISLFICQKSYIVIILKERWLNDLLNCGRVCFTGPSWRSLHQQAMQIKQNLYIFSFTSCKIQLCESVQNLWKPSERERESDYLPHWLYSKMSSTQVGFFFLSLGGLLSEKWDGRVGAAVPISYLVPATLAVMVPFFFLVRTFLFPLLWEEPTDGTLTGDAPWSSGGGDNAEGGKGKMTNTVTVCAPEEEAGVGRLAGREEYDARLFGGFSFVYGAVL